MEIENLGKKSGIIDASISNRIQEMEERISGAEDSIEDINKDFNNSLKEIQENTAKQVEDLKEEAQKSL